MSNVNQREPKAFATLLDLTLRLIESQGGTAIEPGEEWRNEAQALALKLAKHAVSANSLAEVTAVSYGRSETLQHIDHGSMVVIARAALETYLVWHYLYASGNGKTSRFRYLTWRLAGLMDRQRFSATSARALEIKAKELAQAESIRAEIRTYDEFSLLGDKKQRRLLAGDWKIITGTADLAKAAGFHDTYFDNVYAYLCGYSHASYISVLQVAQAKTLQVQAELARVVMDIVVVTLAHFCCNYPNQFPDAQTVLDANSDAAMLARRWALKAEDMRGIYAPVANQRS